MSFAEPVAIAFGGSASVKADALRAIEEYQTAQSKEQLSRVAGWGRFWKNDLKYQINYEMRQKQWLDHHFSLWSIPQEVVRLEEAIGAGLGNEVGFRRSFLEAIPVGANLAMVWPRFALALFDDAASPMMCDGATSARATEALGEIAALFREWTGAGIMPEEDRWHIILRSVQGEKGIVGRAIAAAARSPRSASDCVAREAGEPGVLNMSAVEIHDAYLKQKRDPRSEKAGSAWRWMRDTLLRLLGESAVASKVK